MSNTRQKRIQAQRWILLGIAVSLGAMLALAAYRIHCVVAVQNAFAEGNYINFRDSTEPTEEHALYRALREKLFEYKVPSPFMQLERLRAVFRSTTDHITITHGSALRGDLVAALELFPKLRRLDLLEGDVRYFTSSDLAKFCACVRRLERLEFLALGCGNLDDNALSKIAGHPGLTEIVIVRGELSLEFSETLKSLPNLKEVTVYSRLQHKDWWQTPEESEKIFRAKMPARIKLTFLDQL